MPTLPLSKPHRPPLRISAARLLCLVLCAGAQAVAGPEPSELFVKNCAPCHSKDGKAQTPAARKLGVKDLSVSKTSDEEIARRIREGKLPGEKESKMPAFKDKLTAEEIQSLIETVKAFRAGDAKK